MSTAVNYNENPGLKPYDITEYKGVDGKNFYEEDKLLQYIVEKYGNNYNPNHLKEMQEHLDGYGKIVGSVLNRLTEASHKEGKYGEVIQFDRTGARIDKVVYCEEQVASRKISYEYGIVNLNFHDKWKYPFTTLHKMSLAYLANQNGEGGVTCPLAMTDGIILAIQAIGTEEQKKKYLPLVAGPNSSSHFMAGQYVTERVGGSNVGANRTIAKRAGNGKWILNGEKWFCSNPGDLWVTTAKIEGTNTIGMFLVPRVKEDGTLNGCFILRKKDIIGSRGKITVETVYQDLEAEELGRPAHGLSNLIKYIIRTSRIHLAVATCGIGRRAYMEALEYVKSREAYGKKVIQFESVQKNLAEMNILQSTCTLIVFKNLILEDSGHPLCQILMPLMKYIASIHATWITRQAILLHGGNGILGDFSCLPRLHNDAIINETWEGTHQVITEHVMKAFYRPKAKDAYYTEVHNNLKKAENSELLKPAVTVLKNLIASLKDITENSDDLYIEMNRLTISDLIYNTYALSELLSEGSQEKNPAFFTYSALGFAEISERGKDGLAKKDGIFADTNSMKAVFSF